MLKQFPINHLLYGGLFVLGLVPVVSLSGATGSLAESVQGETSCKAVSTPYQLKVPFGLEDDLKQYIPKDNPLTVEKVELGKLLFFDPRLSRDNTISCASCHKPELAWTDGTKLSMGISNQLSTRNSQILVNRIYGRAQLWHGKFPTLEAQALNPLLKAVRMGMPSSEAEVAKLNGIKGYRDRFRQVFCTDVTLDGIAKAIASFERTILSGNSPADRFDMGGEENALSESAKRGLVLFQGRVGVRVVIQDSILPTKNSIILVSIGTPVASTSGNIVSGSIQAPSAGSRPQPCGRLPERPPICTTVASQPWKRS